MVVSADPEFALKFAVDRKIKPEMPMRPDYWHLASQELAANDPTMAALVARYGGMSLV